MALTYEPISTTTLGTSNTINFTSIPSTYTDLRLVVKGNDTTGGTSLGVRVNGLSASVIYSSYFGHASGATNSVTNNRPSTILVASSVVSGEALTIFDFINYTTTSYWKSGSIITGAFGSTSSGSFSYGAFTIQTTQAISSIFLGSGSGSTLVAGTTATLFGVKAA